MPQPSGAAGGVEAIATGQMAASYLVRHNGDAGCARPWVSG
jgi:hypothetical protein